jgi:hypothetical protein
LLVALVAVAPRAVLFWRAALASRAIAVMFAFRPRRVAQAARLAQSARSLVRRLRRQAARLPSRQGILPLMRPVPSMRLLPAARAASVVG